MANPYRTTVTIDGQKFQAVTTSVKFNTAKDRAGVAQMGSLSTKIRIWADLHDDVNLPFSTVKHLFDMANVVTRDKIRPVKIEFWKDDSQQDALISYSFNGWIRRFETSNPLDFLPRATPVSTEDLLAEGTAPSLNHMLVLDIEPALNQQNFNEIQLSN
jgi:GH24 family phage-related lysozyme (muramidase)